MRKSVLIVGLLLAAGIFWYLFLKPYDYLAVFKVKALPGTINQSLKTWGLSLDNEDPVIQENPLYLHQKMQFGDSVHLYSWKIVPLNDSISKVKVYVKDRDLSIWNKIEMPFITTSFESRSEKTIRDFHKKLNNHLRNIRVEIVGLEDFKPAFCACVTVKTTQIKKAQGMMRNFPLLTSVLAENEVALNGNPFLEIKEWNRKTDDLEYDFCYPIKKSDSLPVHPEINYRTFSRIPSLKAQYNGNYLTSDRAWYSLLKYAKRSDLQVKGLPIEVFHNNPNMGGNEMNWKAEIYMPLMSAHEKVL